MDADERRRRKSLLLRAQQEDLRTKLREAENAVAYEKLLVDLLVLRLRIRALDHVPDLRAVG